MASIFGRYFKAATFGESHGPALGVVVDGAPAGLPLDESVIQKDLDRRKPGTGRHVSARKEADRVEILSGLANGKTLGSPIAMLIRNTGARSRDYEELGKVFRPGHADYTYHAKYGLNTQPGGGRSSGRETTARVAAGAVARRMLAGLGVSITGCTLSIGRAACRKIDLGFAAKDPLRAADPDAARAMADEIDRARSEGDSVGGVVMISAVGVPLGLGDPVFDKLDALLGGAMLSIGAVKGVEIGDGFEAARARGSANNDEMDEGGFLTNHAGGILGGISTGQEIIIRLAIKPTPSIVRPQKTIGPDKKERIIEIKGRHDPCICPRVVPVAEAMAALVLADAWLAARGGSSS